MPRRRDGERASLLTRSIPVPEAVSAAHILGFDVPPPGAAPRRRGTRDVRGVSARSWTDSKVGACGGVHQTTARLSHCLPPTPLPQGEHLAGRMAAISSAAPPRSSVCQWTGGVRAYVCAGHVLSPPPWPAIVYTGSTSPSSASLGTLVHSLPFPSAHGTLSPPRCVSASVVFPRGPPLPLPPLSISELSPWRRIQPCANPHCSASSPLTLLVPILRAPASLSFPVEALARYAHAGCVLARFAQSTRILASARATDNNADNLRCGRPARPRSGGERLLKITRGDNNQATTEKKGESGPIDEGRSREGKGSAILLAVLPPARFPVTRSSRISPGLALLSRRRGH
ncbi:hypothetical protein HPB50_022208 [Hyalomma asiaticum]|uniref:Uncharacterized protein n=1 Tax=Hyalomma asiaticum TaxID=266040 RepID=A0ACB7SBN3_HYAAI|nr:hypothetical protein HPB50_022208 [Hyalomma asiaticum]